MTPQDRIDSYERVMKITRTLWLGPKDQILGVWEMGQNYTVKSGFYGGFPHGYLKRIKGLYPEGRKTLHLFSGEVDTEAFPGDTVDLDFDRYPTFLDNAETLETVPLQDYMLVLADPPYSVEDALHYGPPMVDRAKVIRTLTRLPAGAHVVWLDQVKPMYRKDQWNVYAQIGMSKSVNHRYRQIFVLERKGEIDTGGL